MGPKRPSRFRSVVLSDASQWLPKTRGSCMLVSYRVMCALQPLLSAPCSLTVCNCSTNAARLKRAGTAGCIIMYLSCTVSAHLAWRLEPRFGSRRPAKLACYMRAITDNAQSAACVGRTPFKAYATTNGTLSLTLVPLSLVAEGGGLVVCLCLVQTPSSAARRTAPAGRF